MPVSFTWEASATPGATLGAAAGALALRDKALHPTTGDLYLVDGEQGYLTGIDGLISDLGARLKMFLGEYFLDVTRGVPWFQEILGQKPTTSRIGEILTAQALACPGVTAVTGMQVSQSGRSITARFNAATDFGQLITAVLTAIQAEG